MYFLGLKNMEGKYIFKNIYVFDIYISCMYVCMHIAIWIVLLWL